MESRIPDDCGGYKLAKEVTGLPFGTLYSMVFKKRIPHYRLGNRMVLFSRKELTEWISDHKVTVSTATGGEK